MGFVSAIRSGLSKFSDFSGRSSRSEFWWFTLFQFVAMAGLVALDLLRVRPLVQADPAQLIDLPFAWYATTWGWLALAIPTWALAVRRLHDIDKSGLWYLLNLVPFGALVLLVFFVLPGTRGRNGYGLPEGQEPRRRLQEEPATAAVSPEARQAEIRALRQSRMQGAA